MRGKHVFLKLFVVIALFLAIFIGAIIFFQTKYFGEYYTHIKKTEFQTAIRAAVRDFDNTRLSDENLLSYIKTLYSQYGCAIALIPNEKLDEVNPKNILVNGIYLDRQSNTTVLIAEEAVQYMNDPATYAAGMVKTMRSGETNDSPTYLLYLQTITLNGRPYIMGIASSLQSVGEAMGALVNISWLAFLIAIALSFAIAVIISKLVTQPLVREIEREKALDKMRKDFIANASHEMKTPISIISGYAESLTDGILTPGERAEYEAVIYGESQKMSRLVREMLDIAMLQNNGMPPRKEEFNMAEPLLDTIKRFDQKIRKKWLQVRTDDVTHTVPAFADKIMMETVFTNFLANAISHTPDRGEIFFTLRPQGGDTIYFEIKNEGDPIPDDAIPHIWESFYRADKARGRDDGRYGLGLFAVKTIIEKHNGKVGVRNGDGFVVFNFTITRSTLKISK